MVGKRDPPTMMPFFFLYGSPFFSFPFFSLLDIERPKSPTKRENPPLPWLQTAFLFQKRRLRPREGSLPLLSFPLSHDPMQRAARAKKKERTLLPPADSERLQEGRKDSHGFSSTPDRAGEISAPLKIIALPLRSTHRRSPPAPTPHAAFAMDREMAFSGRRRNYFFHLFLLPLVHFCPVGAAPSSNPFLWSRETEEEEEERSGGGPSKG